MKLMHNGIIEVDHVRPEEVTKLDDHLPASWFGPFTENNGTVKDLTLYPTNKAHLLKFGLIAMKKLNPSASTMGSFTDFNVWSTSLSEEEMVDFTRCRREMKGDLIPWNKEDWTFTQGIGPEEYKVETVDFYSMCSPQARNFWKNYFFCLYSNLNFRKG